MVVVTTPRGERVEVEGGPSRVVARLAAVKLGRIVPYSSWRLARGEVVLDPDEVVDDEELELVEAGGLV